MDNRKRFKSRWRIKPLIGIAVIIAVADAKISICQTESLCIAAFMGFVHKAPVGISAGFKWPRRADLGIRKFTCRFHITPFERRYSPLLTSNHGQSSGADVIIENIGEANHTGHRQGADESVTLNVYRRLPQFQRLVAKTHRFLLEDLKCCHQHETEQDSAS